jgi:hypothetical protein
VGSSPLNVIGQTSFIKKSQDPYCINVSGHSHQMQGLLLDWSFGEPGPIQSWFAQIGMVLTTGYLQSFSDPLLLYQKLDSFDLQIKVGPNPFNNSIYLQSKQDGIVIYKIQMISSSGVMVYFSNESYAGYCFFKIIAVPKLADPIYYLTVYYRIANTLEKFKTYKLIQQ